MVEGTDSFGVICTGETVFQDVRIQVYTRLFIMKIQYLIPANTCDSKCVVSGWWFTCQYKCSEVTTRCQPAATTAPSTTATPSTTAPPTTAAPSTTAATSTAAPSTTVAGDSSSSSAAASSSTTSETTTPTRTTG